MSSELQEKQVTLRCPTCRIESIREEIVLHYRTDWHGYNLKRKVVNLEPISLAEYTSKNIAKLESERSKAKKEERYHCGQCNKSFKSKNTYEDHLESKKHKEKIKSAENIQKTIYNKDISEEEEDGDIEVEEIDSDEWDGENPIERNECLFCSSIQEDFDKNVLHMTSYHSFFIPDIEYCIDIEGLLMYLGEKISKDFICIWCNERGKTFYSLEATRNHMCDKGHCMMKFEGLALPEYVDFYDYSSSYPEAENCENEDDEVSVDFQDTSEFQLVLPSGITVGHRSLMRYYKQTPSRSSALQLSKNSKKLHKTIATYRALGWTQQDQEAAARRSRDLHYIKRKQAKWSMQQGVKNNKFQKHFRQQVNF